MRFEINNLGSQERAEVEKEYMNAGIPLKRLDFLAGLPDGNTFPMSRQELAIFERLGVGFDRAHEGHLQAGYDTRKGDWVRLVISSEIGNYPKGVPKTVVADRYINEFRHKWAYCDDYAAIPNQKASAMEGCYHVMRREGNHGRIAHAQSFVAPAGYKMDARHTARRAPTELQAIKAALKAFMAAGGKVSVQKYDTLGLQIKEAGDTFKIK